MREARKKEQTAKNLRNGKKKKREQNKQSKPTRQEITGVQA
jgi:hypothetical protein